MYVLWNCFHRLGSIFAIFEEADNISNIKFDWHGIIRTIAAGHHVGLGMLAVMQDHGKNEKRTKLSSCVWPPLLRLSCSNLSWASHPL